MPTMVGRASGYLAPAEPYDQRTHRKANQSALAKLSRDPFPKLNRTQSGTLWCGLRLLIKNGPRSSSPAVTRAKENSRHEL
jgi:hypothetical protein